MVGGGAELQIDRQAATKTDGQRWWGESGPAAERQLVTVSMTSDRCEAKQHDRQERQNKQEHANMPALLWNYTCPQTHSPA